MSYNRYEKGLWFDPSDTELNKIFNSLENSQSIIGNNRSCYVFVYGKQRKNKLEEVSSLEGAELIAVNFYGPKILKLFDFMISGYSGLIKLNNSNSIGKILKNLSDLSMVGIFSFDSIFENNFLNYYYSNNYKSYYPEEFIKNNSSYFSFILDGDNAETESGVLAIASYGTKCPNDLSQIFINFGEYGYIGENRLE